MNNNINNFNGNPQMVNGYQPQQSMMNVPQQPMPNNFNVIGSPQQTYGFNQSGTGVVFGNITKQTKSTLTPEEQKILDNLTTSKIEWTDKENIIAMDNFRDQNGNIELEFHDDGTCKTKRGEEFNIVVSSKQEVEELCNLLYNLMMTTKLLNVSLDSNTRRELFAACGFVCKVLPEVYAIALKDGDVILKQIKNIMSPNGFSGNPNMNMYGAVNNGMFNTMPQFVANIAPGQNAGFATGAYQQPYNPMINNNYYGGYAQNSPIPQQNYYDTNNSPFYGGQGNMVPQPIQQPPMVGNVSTNFSQMGSNTPQMNNVPLVNNIPNPGTPVNNSQSYQPNNTIVNPNNNTKQNTTTTTAKTAI